MLGKTYLGPHVSNLDTGELARVSRVTLLVDSSHSYTAGDDSGRTIEKSCPWGTQAMADSILASLRDVDYRPYSGLDGLLDPAAEVGDGITVGGVYSVLAQTDILFDSLGTADVSAPGGDEAEDEYPYKSRAQRQAGRELAQTRSMILKKAEEITMRVENELEQLSATFTVKLDSITSTVQGLNGQVSSIKQYVDNITLSVSNGSTSSTITLKSGSISIASQTIQMNGLVTFTGLSSGATTINGACIQTGTIDAARLNLTGAITFGDLSRDVQNDINDAYSMAADAERLANDVDNTVGSWCYRGTTYIDGAQIMTGTVYASTLEGGEIYLLDGSGRRAGSFTLEGASSYNGRKIVIDSGAIEISSQYGALFLESGLGSSLEFGRYECDVGCSLLPTMDNSWSLGYPRYRWLDIYLVDDPIVTSDREKKTGIAYGLDRYDAFFDALRPVSYRLTDGQSGRTHLGLIAQDVEQALADCGLTDMDFAGFIKSPRMDDARQIIEGEYDYALRYGEFTALCIRRLQALTARVAELERRFAS